MNRNVLYALGGGLILVGFYLYLNSTTPAPALAAASGNQAPTVAAAPSPEGSPPLQGMAARLDKHLFILGPDGDVHRFDGSKLAGVKYFAFYYSASWCPPCRAFTPDLVTFYNNFKPAHADFELIFVGQDQSDGDMVNYMKGDSMPWPAVWFQDNDSPEVGAKRYLGPGIPDLVLVDANGNVLANSFDGNRYLGPQHVIDAIQHMVP
ncbi:MAG: redoxin domain-containing protein [Methylacidiphilales bacterium]|nr:redoxin domain-containing protein [Candidatus Methylacidiphilales bacterium]